MPQKGGHALRAHLEQVYKQTGRKPALLAVEAPPVETLYLWEWFTDLRSLSGDDLTWSDIKAWADVNGEQITPSEANVLKLLNRTLIKVRQEWQKRHA